jgi:hypothetical protein
MQGTLTWSRVFAIALAVRPLLILPVIGSLDAWIGIVGIALHLVLAAAVYVGNRWAIAFGIYAGLQAAASPLLFGSLDLPAMWLWLNAAYGLLLVVLGVMAWRTRRALPA